MCVCMFLDLFFFLHVPTSCNSFLLLNSDCLLNHLFPLSAVNMLVSFVVCYILCWNHAAEHLQAITEMFIPVWVCNSQWQLKRLELEFRVTAAVLC